MPHLQCTGEYGGALVVDGGYQTFVVSPLTMTESEMSFNKATTGPAIATFQRSDETDSVAMSSVAFIDNTLLCDAKTFLDWQTNVRFLL